MVTVLVVVVIALGAALLGFFIGRASGDQQQLKSEYEERLQQAEQELNSYRQQVSEHFHGTAQLVEQMNENYRAVYLHLAKGAQQLTSGESMPAYGGAVIDAEASKERLTADESDSVEPAEVDKAAAPAEDVDLKNQQDQAESARKAGL